jgi:hypothetical protein
MGFGLFQSLVAEIFTGGYNPRLALEPPSVRRPAQFRCSPWCLWSFYKPSNESRF